eukprot:scaffold1947_cov241-Skeletonema_marinoi.AAC.6
MSAWAAHAHQAQRMHSQEDRSGKYEDMFHGESGEEKMMDPMLQLPILLKIMLHLLVAVSDLFLRGGFVH